VDSQKDGREELFERDRRRNLYRDGIPAQ